MPTHEIIYLGKKWPLEAKVNPDIKKVTLSLSASSVLLEAPDGGEIDYTNALVTFYKRQAKKHIEKRVKHFQSMISKSPKNVTIESDERRWGSCNSRGELTFNWKLMMFPEKAIDYVVVHELCHLEHLNHDRSFWRLVGKLCPEYKDIMPILGTEKTRDL